MLEVAITSLKCALRDDYPEFMEFYESKPWAAEEAVGDEHSSSDTSNEEESAAKAEASSDTDECEK